MSKKQKKFKSKSKHKERYFGIVKLPKKMKFCWYAKEDKNGWALGLALEKRTVWLKGLRFADPKEVARALEKTGLVYIQLKNSKYNVNR